MLTEETVSRVADLARLALSDSEKQKLRAELGLILQYVQRLEEADLNDLEATLHPHDDLSGPRRDRAKPKRYRDEALAAAPKAHDNAFAVPKVLELGA